MAEKLTVPLLVLLGVGVVALGWRNLDRGRFSRAIVYVSLSDWFVWGIIFGQTMNAADYGPSERVVVYASAASVLFGLLAAAGRTRFLDGVSCTFWGIVAAPGVAGVAFLLERVLHHLGPWAVGWSVFLVVAQRALSRSVSGWMTPLDQRLAVLVEMFRHRPPVSGSPRRSSTGPKKDRPHRSNGVLDWTAEEWQIWLDTVKPTKGEPPGDIAALPSGIDAAHKQ
jgi:hypothetical protein